jgi:hypothetical protein
MTLILSGTNGLSDVDGDASTPAVRGTDANSGIFFGADQVGVATNGVERVEFGNSETVFNDGGADVDFRVEGDTDANLLFVDASTDRVGVGTNTPSGLFDVASRGITKGSLPAGSVLQVVNSTVAPSGITTTSTSFVTTGVSISITPSATSSKIIILLTGGGHYVPEAAHFCYVTVFRGATNIGNATYGLESYYATGGSDFEIRSHALSVVDSPNTTSSTTYTFYFRKDGGPAAYQFNGVDRSELTIIAMEIAA